MVGGYGDPHVVTLANDTALPVPKVASTGREARDRASARERPSGELLAIRYRRVLLSLRFGPVRALWRVSTIAPGLLLRLVGVVDDLPDLVDVVGDAGEPKVGRADVRRLEYGPVTQSSRPCQ